MNRIGIRFERPSNGPCMFRLYQTPRRDGREPMEVQSFSLTGAQIGEKPKEAGEALLTELRNNNDVSDAFDFALAQEDLVPVYLEMAKGAEIADAYPWEFLFSDHKRFLALSGFWPVARSFYSATYSNVTSRELTISSNLPQVRVLAVFGAGDDWVWEWKAFHDLRAKAAEMGCDFQLRILVGHANAADQINREAGSRIASPFRNVDELWELLRGEVFVPNILHFLCHGTSRTDPAMHCATILDHETGLEERFDVIAPSELLSHIPQTDFLWMIVLNCCELGDGKTPSQQSFARKLLGNEAPVVIAHRAPIEVTDAEYVTRGLYQAIFKKALKVLHEDDSEVDWADVLDIARERLIAKHKKSLGQSYTAPEAAEKTVQWSLPAVYVTSPPFIMHARQEPPDPTSNAHDVTFSALRRELLDVSHLPHNYRREINRRDLGISSTAEDSVSQGIQDIEILPTVKQDDEEAEGFATNES